MMRELAVVCLAAAVVGGCGSKNDRCVPGASAPCACAGGQTGAQTCKADGTYDVCQCDVAGIGGNGSGGDDGGTSTGGSSGGDGGSSSGGSGGDGGTATGSAKRVFVTSLAYDATVAPTVCQSVADSAGLGGTWVAWLSEKYTTESYPAIDTVKGTGPWKLLTGETAFANHGQLATAPSVMIDVTEMGTKLDVNASQVWTGTATGGQPDGLDCGGWSSNSGASYGLVGSFASPATWTDSGSSAACSYANHVYCFEQ